MEALWGGSGSGRCSAYPHFPGRALQAALKPARILAAWAPVVGGRGRRGRGRVVRAAAAFDAVQLVVGEGGSFELAHSKRTQLPFGSRLVPVFHLVWIGTANAVGEKSRPEKTYTTMSSCCTKAQPVWSPCNGGEGCTCHPDWGIFRCNSGGDVRPRAEQDLFRPSLNPEIFPTLAAVEPALKTA